jgi:beta-galactosidase
MFVKNPQPTFEVPSNSKWDYPDIFPSWTWDGYEGELMEVTVYSNCEKVSLTLNGRELGSSETGMEHEYQAIFKVPYEEGTLLAVGYRGETPVDSFALKTAGDPVAVRISADRELITADGQDLSFLTVEVVDGKGTRLPFAEELIEFKIEGPGEIIGVGSAKPNSVESFQQQKRTTFEGRCLAIVKSSREAGEIRITAQSGNLEAAAQVVSSR